MSFITRAVTARSLGKPLSLIGSSLPKKHLLKCFPATGAQYFHAKRLQQMSKTEQVLFFPSKPDFCPLIFNLEVQECQKWTHCLPFYPPLSFSAIMKLSRRGFWSSFPQNSAVAAELCSFPPAHPMRNLSWQRCYAHLPTGRVNWWAFVAANCETDHFSYLQTTQQNQCFGFSLCLAS